MKQAIRLSIFILLLLGLRQDASAQSSDALFTQARSLAFDKKDYPAAIALSKKALLQSPDYVEIRTFLGRLYTWSKAADSARRAFEQVLRQQPDYEDGYVAYGNLEYWNDQSREALNIVNRGLQHIPGSETLQILKVRLLADLKDWKAADTLINQVLAQNKKNTEARSLSNKIRENSSLNRIGISYDYIDYDKQFAEPWHLLSVDYGRQTTMGTVIARVNYTHRFARNGLQFEADAYPRISDTFQSYVNMGFSSKDGVFPQFRAGFSLYASLPSSFEAEAGFRFLQFSEATWIYTASVGKYYKNFWFNLRTYLSPASNAFSQSFALTTRYYLGGADDYLSLALNSGLSPDEQQNNILLQNGTYKLSSKGITLAYRKLFNSVNVIHLSAALDRQEYIKDTKGNRLDLGIAYIRRF